MFEVLLKIFTCVKLCHFAVFQQSSTCTFKIYAVLQGQNVPVIILSSSKIEKFSENSRFFTFFHIQRRQNKLFWPLFCLFHVFCHMYPAHLRIHKDQLSINKKKTSYYTRKMGIFFFKLPTRPGKFLFRKIKANKMRITSKQYLGICGLVSRQYLRISVAQTLILFLCQNLAKKCQTLL